MKSSMPMRVYIVCVFGLLSSLIGGQTVNNLNDSGPGSLREAALNANSGDVIRFDPSLIANGSDTLKLDFTISFTQGVSIKGLFNQTDTLYISGQDSVQIFYMDFSSNPGETVILDSLVLIHGFSNVSGGAIYVEDANELSIENCVFSDNSCDTSFFGGAVYCLGGMVNIHRSRFIDNRTYSSGGSIAYGGAVRLTIPDTVYITECVFSRNQAEGGGGALAVFGGELFISNSEFNSNTSFDGFSGGGALYLNSCDSVLLEKLVFRGNQSLRSGAVFGGFVNGVFIDRCLFDDNSSSSVGGAINFSNSNGTIKHSTFSSNKAISFGGAIYSRDGNMDISSSTFKGDSSGANGDHIYVGKGAVQIHNSTLISNLNSSSDAIHTGTSNQGSFNIGSTIVFAASGQLSISGQLPKSSNNYNIFSDSPNFSTSTDQTNVSSTQLDLGPLTFNGGITETMLPGPNSLALNMGNPADFSEAQNGPVFGRRDVGAAERAIIVSDTLLACSAIQWWGNTYSNAGVYTDTAFNVNSIDSVGVLVLENQDTSVMIFNGTLISLEDDPGTTYQWVDCDNGFSAIAGETDSSFFPSANGSYAVILSNGNCVDTSACVLYNQFNIDTETLTSGDWLTFYPNPTSGNIRIHTEDVSPQILEVLDLSGRLIERMELNGETELKLPLLPSGTYFLRWTGDHEKVQVNRVVIF